LQFAVFSGKRLYFRHKGRIFRCIKGHNPKSAWLTPSSLRQDASQKEPWLSEVAHLILPLGNKTSIITDMGYALEKIIQPTGVYLGFSAINLLYNMPAWDTVMGCSYADSAVI